MNYYSAGGGGGGGPIGLRGGGVINGFGGTLGSGGSCGLDSDPTYHCGDSDGSLGKGGEGTQMMGSGGGGGYYGGGGGNHARDLYGDVCIGSGGGNFI
jgi:hypothetical protein